MDVLVVMGACEETSNLRGECWSHRNRRCHAAIRRTAAEARACSAAPPLSLALALSGTSVAYFYSLFFTILSIRSGGRVGEDNTCFETSAMLITFMLLGKFLETAAKGRASEAVSKLLTLQPPTALKVVGGEAAVIAKDKTPEAVEEVPAASLLPTDVVKVFPGATIPADGIVVAGESAVNEAMISGEALPVQKEAHDKAVGGSVNGNGVLWVRVNAVGADSVLSKIMKLVSDAQMRKPAVQAQVHPRLPQRASPPFDPPANFAPLLSCLRRDRPAPLPMSRLPRSPPCRRLTWWLPTSCRRSS